jgi:WD40 repeat protein
VASGGAATGVRSPTESQGVVTIWDLTQRDKGPIAELRAHPDSIVSVVFSPDGKTLATTGRDGKVHLWDFSNVLEAASAPTSD